MICMNVSVATPFHRDLALLTVVTGDEVYKTLLIISVSGWPREPRRGSTAARLSGIAGSYPARSVAVCLL